MLPKELLTPQLAKAFLIYGGPGTRKTNGVHTLPPPVLHLDMESGDSSITPWQRRTRKFNETDWITISQEQRVAAFNALSEENQNYIKSTTKIQPAPLIDTVYFDSLNPASWMTFTEFIVNLDKSLYNSLALDSLQESSLTAQTFVKQQSNMSVYAPMHVSLWTPAQHRVNLMFHKLKNYKDDGLFIYFTCSETVDKDYVTDPRSAPSGAAPEQPYSVKGTPNLPGQLIGAIQHVTDVMCHARSMNGQIQWISGPEPFTGGSVAVWEAKDRTGRLKSKFNVPSIKSMIKDIYGESQTAEIYKYGYELVRSQSAPEAN